MSISDKLVTIAENEQRVYDKGYAEGAVAFDAFWKREATHITIPSGVTVLKAYVLDDQSNLESLDLPDGLVELQASCMNGCVNLTLKALPESITTIGSQAFYNCYKLALEKLPDGIKTIPSYCFQRCRAMPLKSLPSALEVIDRTAFSGCSMLSVTKIPASVTNIGNEAFAGCASLTSLTFEGTPTSISANAFVVCGNLKTIKVPWERGEVANAPWGATNATVIYSHDSNATTFFLVDSTEWDFDANMTWQDFIDSAHNKGGAFLNSTISIDADGNKADTVGYMAYESVRDANGNPVHPTDNILPVEYSLA